jgi:hypothetical protein
MVEQQQLAGTSPGAVSSSNQPSSTGGSTSGMRLSAPAGDSETPGAYVLSTDADSSSRPGQERIMLQESSTLQEAAVRTLTSCTPLLTSGRLLGIGGLANCTVSALRWCCAACYGLC